MVEIYEENCVMVELIVGWKGEDEKVMRIDRVEREFLEWNVDCDLVICG